MLLLAEPELQEVVQVVLHLLLELLLGVEGVGRDQDLQLGQDLQQGHHYPLHLAQSRELMVLGRLEEQQDPLGFQELSP